MDDTTCDGVVECWGRGQRLGMVPLGEGRTYVFLTENAPRGAPASFTDVEGLRTRFAGYPAPADALLAKLTSLTHVLHNDLEDGIAPRWWAPRRVLIGDAAHAVTPHMGQGAGLALEDAACLAALLADDGAQTPRWRGSRRSVSRAPPGSATRPANSAPSPSGSTRCYAGCAIWRCAARPPR